MQWFEIADKNSLVIKIVRESVRFNVNCKNIHKFQNSSQTCNPQIRVIIGFALMFQYSTAILIDIYLDIIIQTNISYLQFNIIAPLCLKQVKKAPSLQVTKHQSSSIAMLDLCL